MKTQFKVVVVIAFILFSFTGIFAQQQLNDYKYVIVPEKFSCQKSVNIYQLNGLTKFLLEKQNFKTFLGSEDLPEDVANNNCLALFVDVTEDNTMFKTKLIVVFKDCRNKVIFTTNEGVSRDKVYKVSFNKALREALKTLESFKHDYTKKELKPIVIIKTEPKPLVKEDVEVEVKVKDTPKKEIKEENKAVIVKEVPKKEELKVKTKPNQTLQQSNSLKAELIVGSVFNYQLKNKKKETVYTILFSGKEDMYMVKGKDALIYKMNNIWVIAEYSGNVLQVKTLDIQF